MQSNHLINEKSPYLLQHAHNPVEWHPWSESAFNLAKKEDKPIFLSIGYATCHWCHVMERESFEDEEAARYLNETFICIKVDREERPDIDAVYMAACQMLTGRGGWPLTIFMTPDKRPFFAGTYIPKRAKLGQGGLIDLCRHIRQMWTSDRKRIFDSANEVAGHLATAFSFQPDTAITEPILNQAFTQLKQGFDPKEGGFLPAPKFPTPHRLLFLLRHYHRTGKQEALEMVTSTLTAMRSGGIWDHVGFGFHRYSTDSHWLLPHFEKMLYDQALLAFAYIEAYQVTENSLFSQTAEEIFTYVLRDMMSEEGGFYAAEDADSEGEEGKFYVWSPAEFTAVAGPGKAERWAGILNIKTDGNFADEAGGQKSGDNIPHLALPLSQWAEILEIGLPDLEQEWEALRDTLFQSREERIHPLKDDKTLTDWNGLMIAALAAGGRVLGNREYIRAAEDAFRFLDTKMRNADKKLLHRFREGEAGIAAHADDYAFLIWGAIELHQATMNPHYIEKAVQLQKEMLDDFWDGDSGGFYFTSDTAKDALPVRPKEIYDGATPSANSVALHNMLRLGHLTGDSRWDECADQLVRAFSGTVKAQPSAFTHFLMGGDFIVGSPSEVVIAGEADAPDTRAMMDRLQEGFSPRRVILLKTAFNRSRLAALAEFTAPLESVNGKATAYICKDRSCHTPVTDIETFCKVLDDG